MTNVNEDDQDRNLGDRKLWLEGMTEWVVSTGQSVWGTYIPAGTKYRTFETEDAGWIQVDQPLEHSPDRTLIRI